MWDPASQKQRLVASTLLVLLAFIVLLVFSLNQSGTNSSSFKVYQSGKVEKSIEQLTAPVSHSVTERQDNAGFTLLNRHYVNLGQRHALWVKIVGVMPGSILVIQRNRIATPAQLYYQLRGQSQSQASNWHEQTLHGTSQFHNHLVANVPKNVLTDTLYLKLNGQYLRATINAYDNPGFFHFLQSSALYNGLYYGLLLLFILYNLMLYVRLKTPSYLAYSVLLTLLFLWFLSGQGWLQFLFPKAQVLQHITVVLGLMLAISGAEFAKQYLQIKSLSARLNRLLTRLQWLCAGFLLIKLTVADYLPPLVYSIGYGGGLIAAISLMTGCFAGALIGVKQGRSSAWYYLWATVLFFIVAILMGLSAGNVIQIPFSWRFLQLASVIEVIIFSAGLVSIMHQQQQQKSKIEAELSIAQDQLLKQLQISNDLKDKIMNSAIEPKLIPQLAKITDLLSDIHYIQADGNWCLVHYQKGNRNKQIALECNLQNLTDNFGNSYFVRVHKSYLINPQQPFSLQRRTSADYDLALKGAQVPVGRKYLSEVKALVCSE